MASRYASSRREDADQVRGFRYQHLRVLISIYGSFMKDLATLRSPQSPITFLSYLHSQNRLSTFINRGSSIPTRKEYADYLSWAASYVQKQGINVLYGHEVVALTEGPGDTIAVKSQNVATGEEIIRLARECPKSEIVGVIVINLAHRRYYYCSGGVSSNSCSIIFCQSRRRLYP